MDYLQFAVDRINDIR